MLRRAKRRVAVLAAVLATALGLGYATPALAEGEPTYGLADAKLTKVIDAPMDTDASSDSYVFHFAGGGTVRGANVQAGENENFIFSDDVEQDSATLQVGDVVPTIPDATLGGVSINNSNSLSNGQVGQSIVQKPLSEILDKIVWPHAGIYTYIVTEKSTSTALTNDTYINASQAEYILRIYVKNKLTGGLSSLGNKELVPDRVTIDRVKDDNGAEWTEGKVDPRYPVKADGSDKVSRVSETESPGGNELAGDDRGRNVPGFTFANEYMAGGAFSVKKLYDGDLADRTRYSTVELMIYSEAAKNPDAQGCCVTYQIEGEGKDLTENPDNYGGHMRLNGVYDIPQSNHFMAVFKDDGWCYIKADLKENSVIRITGEFGPYNPAYQSEAPNQKDCRKTLSTSGLLNGQDYYVIERDPGHYRPTGYVYAGPDANIDPRKNSGGMEPFGWVDVEKPDPTYHDSTNPNSQQANLPPFALCVQEKATGAATTVFIVNWLDPAKVAPTGIFIENLPYILMVGIPVAVFAAMFVIKHRENAAA